jgi:hypothetical protein
VYSLRVNRTIGPIGLRQATKNIDTNSNTTSQLLFKLVHNFSEHIFFHHSLSFTRLTSRIGQGEARLPSPAAQLTATGSDISCPDVTGTWVKPGYLTGLQPLTSKVHHSFKLFLEEDWEAFADNLAMQLQTVLTGMILVRGFSGALWGEELPKLDLGAICKH